MTYISSKDNIKIKDLIKLRDDPKFRDDKSLFYVEGERLISDTPNELIDKIYIEENKVDKFKYITDKILSDNCYIIKADIFEKIKDTANSQGIIAAVRYSFLNNLNEEFLKKIKNILILDNISDPGNLGTIIRMSEAANIDLLILNGCCNITNTKVIRACMSSIFRQKIYITNDIIRTINLLKKFDFTIFATKLDDNSIKFNDVNFKNKNVIIIGNEANGISDDAIKLSDKKIIIPMCGKIESLNAAIASSIICYEIMRQNNYYEN